MGLFGGGNSTSSNTSNNFDQRQVNTTTIDNSQTSTSSNTLTNILDGGAIAEMGKIAGQVVNNGVVQVKDGYDYADHIFDAATTFANEASARSASAFDTAAAMTRDTLTGAKSAYSDATKAVMTAYGNQAELMKSAYADSKGTTDAQKQIIMGVLVVAGLFVLATMQRKAG
jgi:hypothetical protein